MTWLTSVLKQSSSTLTFLNLADNQVVQAYNLSALCWQDHNLTYVFSVSKDQLLLL